jgi:hypothetical protein
MLDAEEKNQDSESEPLLSRLLRQLGWYLAEALVILKWCGN